MLHELQEFIGTTFNKDHEPQGRQCCTSVRGPQDACEKRKRDNCFPKQRESGDIVAPSDLSEPCKQTHAENTTKRNSQTAEKNDDQLDQRWNTTAVARVLLDEAQLLGLR